VIAKRGDDEAKDLPLLLGQAIGIWLRSHAVFLELVVENDSVRSSGCDGLG